MTLLDVAGGGKPLAGAAVYVWHCDRAGRYSLYDEAIAGENYLRGVQESDADGTADVQDDLPGRLPGPLAAHPLRDLREPRRGRPAAGRSCARRSSRIPQDACDAVYATAGYEQSVQNLAQTSLDSDMVFSDGYASQLATRERQRRATATRSR